MLGMLFMLSVRNPGEKPGSWVMICSLHWVSYTDTHTDTPTDTHTHMHTHSHIHSHLQLHPHGPPYGTPIHIHTQT